MDRFINADSYVSTGIGTLGYNMYAYCNNNPVMCVDNTGNAPNWIKNAVDFLVNYIDAGLSALEFESGLGFGLGLNNCIFRDFYLGLDDGDCVLGNILSLNLSSGFVSVGATFTHSSERNLKSERCRECGIDYSAWDMITCSHSTKTITVSLTCVTLAIDIDDISQSSIIVGASPGLHAILGGHVSVGYNITDFYRKVFFENE